MNFHKTILRGITGVMTASLIGFFSWGSAGCGGAAGLTEPPVSSENLAQEAMAFLESGSISEAQAKYDASLDADPDNTEAAFGAAITRIMSLPESDPSNKILRSLGQMEFKTANMVGPTGYLNELNEFNKTTVSLDGLSGQFFGTITGYSYEGSFSFTDPESGTAQNAECLSREIYGYFRGDDGKTELSASLTIEKVTKINGAITSSFLLKPGDVVDVQQRLDSTVCFGGFGGIPVVSFSLYRGDSWSGRTSSSTGAISIKSVGANEGDAVELELQSVILGSGDASSSFTLNGTIADTVTGEDVDPSKYLPFGELKGGKGLNHLLSKTVDGYTSDQVLEDIAGYHPLLEEIIALLDQADQSDDFQFTFPKGLYFGTKDVTINRIDLKSCLAGMHFFQAGLYLAESWRYPIDLGTLFDTEGNRIISLEDLVGQLNEFFTLREDHRLDEAQVELTIGLQTLLEAHDLLPTVTKDGVFEAVPGLEEAYAQLRDVVEIAQASLDEAQIFPYLEPNLTIDLNRFFNHPPDARNVDVDPFVIENGKIKFVEAFFKEMTEGIIDVELTGNYQHAFTAIKKDPFLKGVFDEFDAFFIAGHFYSVGGSD
jgi:hypothetical protein